MKMDILTLFPEMFEGVLGSSILKKAEEKGIVHYHLVNFRKYSDNKHKTVDDYPYGGGAGMVLKPQPVFDAVEDLLEGSKKSRASFCSAPREKRIRSKKRKRLRKKNI